MPEEPDDATVVATVMPVDAELVLLMVSPIGPALPDHLDVPDAAQAVSGKLWKWPGSVTVDVAVCVWLTVIASAEPPVSSAVSNSGLLALKPTGTRPAPNATQVPKPSSVPGLVEFVALI